MLLAGDCAAYCGPICKCDAAVIGRQSLAELDFTRSACAAALAGQHAKLEQLLARGGPNGQVQSADGSGYTALHYAARNGHAECAALLLRHRAQPDATTRGGATSLHRAAFGGHAKVATMLLDAKADATCQDSDGDTPLHKAVAQGEAAVAHLLLRRCEAAAALRDRRGRRPHDLARSEQVASQLAAAAAAQDAAAAAAAEAADVDADADVVAMHAGAGSSASGDI